jgi:hypothetical protein
MVCLEEYQEGEDLRTVRSSFPSPVFTSLSFFLIFPIFVSYLASTRSTRPVLIAGLFSASPFVVVLLSPLLFRLFALLFAGFS